MNSMPMNSMREAAHVSLPVTAQGVGFLGERHRVEVLVPSEHHAEREEGARHVQTWKIGDGVVRTPPADAQRPVPVA